MIIDALQKRVLSFFEKKLIIQALLNDHILAFPTDTVYGLGVNGFSKNAVHNIYALKGREDVKPLILLTDSISKIDPFILGLNEPIKLFMQENWPGPVTIVLPYQTKSSLVFSKIPSPTLACRIPNHFLLTDLLSELPFPLVTTSANISGTKPIHCAMDIESTFGKNPKFSFVIDGGEVYGVTSRIVSYQNGICEVIRT